MPSFLTFTFVLALAATAIAHPLQSRDLEKSPENIPVAVIQSFGGYGGDIESADPKDVLGKRAENNPTVHFLIEKGGAYNGDIESANGEILITSGAYDGDIESADAKEVLGKRVENIPIEKIQAVFIKESAYDKDISAADAGEVLGKRAENIPIAAI